MVSSVPSNRLDCLPDKRCKGRARDPYSDAVPRRIRPDLFVLWPAWIGFPIFGLAVLALGVQASDGTMVAIGIALLAVNIALSNRSAPYWLNALTAEDEPVAIVTATRMEFGPAAELLDAAERRGLGAAAFDAAGFSAAGLALASIQTITPDALAEESTTILDVRELDEWTSGHVPGAVWIPLDELSRRLDEVPAGPVAAICASGFRSSAAVSLLEAAGRDRLPHRWGGKAGRGA